MDRNVLPSRPDALDRIVIQIDDMAQPDRRPEQIDAPGMYVNRMVHHVLGGIEQERPADKLALLGFLLDPAKSGGSGASSSGVAHEGKAIDRARECLKTLEAAGESSEEVCSTLIQRLQASLPRYMAEAIQSRSRPGHAHATAGAGSLVASMRAAQAAGAQATERFAHCDNPTKLRLLGFSHSRFFADELGPMLDQYENQKSPFLNPVVVGYAFKDGFNEVLVDGLPENQRERFRKILAEPDYDKRREDLVMAILEFLEDPGANLHAAASVTGNAGVTTTTDTGGGNTTTTTTTTTTAATPARPSGRESEDEDSGSDDTGSLSREVSFSSSLAAQVAHQIENAETQQEEKTGSDSQ